MSAAFAAQLLPAGGQPTIQTSFGNRWEIQRILPDSRSIAITESLVTCCGSVYMLPVETYTSFLAASIVGALQMPAPDGPQRSEPAFVFPIGLAFSDSVYVFHTTLPLRSRTTRLPRNLQQGYAGLRAVASSPDAIGTYSRS